MIFKALRCMKCFFSLLEFSLSFIQSSMYYCQAIPLQIKCLTWYLGLSNAKHFCVWMAVLLSQLIWTFSLNILRIQLQSVRHFRTTSTSANTKFNDDEVIDLRQGRPAFSSENFFMTMDDFNSKLQKNPLLGSIQEKFANNWRWNWCRTVFGYLAVTKRM